MSRSTSEDFREEASKLRRQLVGMVRRLVVSITDGGIWQTTGGFLATKRTKETRPVEVFQGIGIAARPPANGSAEAIIANVAADAEHPVIVGLRDEKTRQAVAAALGVDETMLYNSLAVVHITEDEVHVRTVAGTAERLLKLAAATDLKTAIAGTALVPGDPGAAALAAIKAAFAAWNPAATDVLKGQ